MAALTKLTTNINLEMSGDTKRYLVSAIVKKQQTIIEQSKIEETVKAELRQDVEETDREMDVLEYHMRKYCDTDDIEATEFGKENAVDD